MTMSREALLKAEFAPKGVLRGGELYLPAAEALSFVRRAEELGLAVIGIEGIRIDECDVLVPDETAIADWSGRRDEVWSVFVLERARLSEAFLNEYSVDVDLLFSLVVLSE